MTALSAAAQLDFPDTPTAAAKPWPQRHATLLVAERKSLLCTAFLFLALAAYGWYVRKPTVARYLAIVLFFVLGLMAKPMIITLPCALLLLDYWPLARFRTERSSPHFSSVVFKVL